jgi:hypothetical protein
VEPHDTGGERGPAFRKLHCTHARACLSPLCLSHSDGLRTTVDSSLPPALCCLSPAHSTLRAAAAPSFNPLGKLFAGCPDNAFQKVPPGYAPFSLAQRTGAVVRNGEACAAGYGTVCPAVLLLCLVSSPQLRCCVPLRCAACLCAWSPCGWLGACALAARAFLMSLLPLSLLSITSFLSHCQTCPRTLAGMKLFGVGFCASLLGVGITNGLMGVRQMLDPSFMPLNPPQVRPGLCFACATPAVCPAVCAPRVAVPCRGCQLLAWLLAGWLGGRARPQTAWPLGRHTHTHTLTRRRRPCRMCL